MLQQSMPALYTRQYRTVSRVKGPLIFVDHISNVAFNEMVEITAPDNTSRYGRVLELDDRLALVQVFEGTEGLDMERTLVRFTGDVGRLDVSISMIGRILDGTGKPLDDEPPIIPQARPDLNGLPINPTARREPREFIQTGVSAIDGLNTLARGQKLPIFSASGLPGNRLAAQVATQARVIGKGAADEEFAVVFAGIGITHRESAFFVEAFRETGALERSVVFLNLADDPTIERILTPRAALTTAEYLAFTHNRHVLVIITDMTNYCEALREVAAAREEIPGRRGYPGYMYSDLASLYERAGRLHQYTGSVTQMMMLTMPDDDITHPIPDLTGYITEGQIVLKRELHQRGIYPPVDVLPSLSRLMNVAIGEGRTREDHRAVADQLYSLYAAGIDQRRMVSIVGEGALSDEDRRMLHFADRFEKEYLNQGDQNREVLETLNKAWQLLSDLPQQELKRIPEQMLETYGSWKKEA